MPPTCLDGYPLAQQGKAGYAIGAAATANSLGGLIGTVSVLAVLPVAQQLVLLFGPPEFFLLAVLGAGDGRGEPHGAECCAGSLTGGLGLMIVDHRLRQRDRQRRSRSAANISGTACTSCRRSSGCSPVAEMINLSVKGGSRRASS